MCTMKPRGQIAKLSVNILPGYSFHYRTQRYNSVLNVIFKFQTLKRENVIMREQVACIFYSTGFFISTTMCVTMMESLII